MTSPNKILQAVVQVALPAKRIQRGKATVETVLMPGTVCTARRNSINMGEFVVQAGCVYATVPAARLEKVLFVLNT